MCIRDSLASAADCGPAVLDCFRCIFDLEVAAIGGEDGVGRIVAGAYRGLRSSAVSTISCRLPVYNVLAMAGVQTGVVWMEALTGGVVGHWCCAAGT